MGEATSGTLGDDSQNARRAEEEKEGGDLEKWRAKARPEAETTAPTSLAFLIQERLDFEDGPEEYGEVAKRR